jgi:hypothetical protein
MPLLSPIDILGYYNCCTDGSTSPGHFLLLLFNLPENGALLCVSGTTIRHNTQK